MTRTRLLNLTMASVFAASTLGAAAAACAKSSDTPTNEAAIMANAKVTMAQAITSAEQQSGGKAVGSGIEDQDGAVFLEVQVLKDKQRQKVLIDPQSGQVVKTVKQDNERNENGHENDDD